MSSRQQYTDMAMAHCILQASKNLEGDEANIVRVWLDSLPCPCNPPYIVKLAIAKRFRYDLVIVEMKINSLRNYGLGTGMYYGFEHNDTFFGVEPDGYLHT